jgi:hypothetical protein
MDPAGNAPSCHTISKYLAAIAERSVRSLKGAAAFDTPQRG